MSTEPEPYEATLDNPPPSEDQPPVPEEPSEPEPSEEEPPQPPEQPGELVAHVEPATWYEVTSYCATPTCVNLYTFTTEPLAYSNAGDLRMICARCSQYRPITKYTKADPQPEMT